MKKKNGNNDDSGAEEGRTGRAALTIGALLMLAGALCLSVIPAGSRHIAADLPGGLPWLREGQGDLAGGLGEIETEMHVRSRGLCT